MDEIEDIREARNELLLDQEDNEFLSDAAVRPTLQTKMSSFFGKIYKGLGWGPIPTKVAHIQWSDYANQSFLMVEGMFLIAQLPDDVDDELNLAFEVLIQADYNNIKYAYSLMRTQTEEEARNVYAEFQLRLPPLVESCGREVLNHTSLQKVTDLIREKPSWHVGHLIAYFGYLDALNHEKAISYLNQPEENEGLYPIHIAVENESEKVISALLSAGVIIDICDKNGNNPLHIAASKSLSVLQAFKNNQKDNPLIINKKNNKGETPLLISAQQSKLENIKMLLSLGANVNHKEEVPALEKMSNYFDKIKIIENSKEISHKDLHKGGSLLHWVKNRELTEICLEIDCDTNLLNNQGQSPLHVLVQRNRVACVVTLLCHGADPNMKDNKGNTPLHYASHQLIPVLVQAFIAFGADINSQNNMGESPRHLASIDNDKTKSADRDKVIYLLHTVGAKRCNVKLPSCLVGCLSGGSFNGVPVYEPPKLRSRWVMDETIADMQIQETSSWQLKNNNGAAGTGRVLCLDGGGIKGLVLTQMLFFLQELLGRPIHECFDWISGTSTGGFLALMLASGKSVQECQSLYYCLKEKVFVGSRPYDSAPLEDMLRKEFGDEAVMSDIKSPKVMVTTTLADRLPPDLHLFRNYESPLSILGVQECSNFMKLKPPSEQKIWEAARCSGAAPSYFSACGQFLDGGLVSNNPVLDTLTEIGEWNMALKKAGREDEVFTPTVVVSLGCGKPPVESVENVDLAFPSMLELRKGFQAMYNMFNLLVEQSCASEGRIVDRARIWCSDLHVPFFRLTPQFSEDLLLDEAQDENLVRAMWETKAYMTSQHRMMEQLKPLLQPQGLATPSATLHGRIPPIPTPPPRRERSVSNPSTPTRGSNTTTPTRSLSKVSLVSESSSSGRGEVSAALLENPDDPDDPAIGRDEVSSSASINSSLLVLPDISNSSVLDSSVENDNIIIRGKETSSLVPTNIVC